jgi:hypothetical protein
MIAGPQLATPQASGHAGHSAGPPPSQASARPCFRALYHPGMRPRRRTSTSSDYFGELSRAVEPLGGVGFRPSGGVRGPAGAGPYLY